MMPAIQVHNISKTYKLGISGAQTFHAEISATLGKLFHKSSTHLQESCVFRALNDVSFDIAAGQTVGIIGSNGAGKSTLLKILTRITAPTSGHIIMHGRVASLLEVGTGFHPELTGRENIFMNGAILGMKRWEIREKMEEIIEFAGVQNFIDTPVKRYSSGMYVRLAFAVAAHLEPDILIVDEVLAVGDATFQRKCINKLQAVARTEGRTVLFVSHDNAAIKRLCQQAVLLENGRVKATGDVNDVLRIYDSPAPDGYSNPAATKTPKISKVEILSNQLTTNENLIIRINWTIPINTPGILLGLGFNVKGERVFDSTPMDNGYIISDLPGDYTAHVTIPRDSLMPRNYQISVGLWKEVPGHPSIVYDRQEAAADCPMEGAGSLQATSERQGLIQVACQWESTALRKL